MPEPIDRQADLLAVLGARKDLAELGEEDQGTARAAVWRAHAAFGGYGSLLVTLGQRGPCWALLRAVAALAFALGRLAPCRSTR